MESKIECNENVSEEILESSTNSQVVINKVSAIPASQSTEVLKDEHGLIAACDKGSLKTVKHVLEHFKLYYACIDRIYIGLYGVSSQ